MGQFFLLVAYIFGLNTHSDCPLVPISSICSSFRLQFYIFNIFIVFSKFKISIATLRCSLTPRQLKCIVHRYQIVCSRTTGVASPYSPLYYSLLSSISKGYDANPFPFYLKFLLFASVACIDSSNSLSTSILN